MTRFAAPDVERATRADGAVLLRARALLGEYPRCVGVWLEHWAEAAPERTFLAERGRDGAWATLSFAAARAGARAVGQALLDRGLGPERPLAVLSENGIDHALLALGALHAGVPVAPVSTAFSLASRDLAKLRHVAALVRPGLVYARDAEAYEAALAAVDWGGAEIATGGVDALLATRAGRALVAALAPLVEDCVIAAPDRDAVGVLAFPSLAGCRSIAPYLPADATAEAIATDSTVRGALVERLRCHNDARPGTSARVARALLLTDAPSIDAGEITDKGYLNQRAVLAHRAAVVERLFAEPPDPSVLVP